MVSGGRELIVGMTRDPSVGALLMFGLGGTLVEVLHDVVFRLAPISRLDAADMIRGIRSFRLLEGVRGAPPANLSALEDVLLRVSRLVTDFPEIVELDVNPVLAFADRAIAVDARVMLNSTPA
jgi:acetyltransferase